MALEAAKRQLQAPKQNYVTSVSLSDLHFKVPLPLERFQNLDTIVELQLCARQVASGNLFEFEILSVAQGQEETSILHCAGKYRWTNVLTQNAGSIDWNLTNGKPPEQACLISPSSLERLHDLQISIDGATGAFRSLPDQFEDSCITPLVLDSLLQIPPTTLARDSLPATYKLLSISSIEVPLDALSLVTSPGRFAVRNTSIHELGCHSRMEIRLEKSSILLTGLKYEVDELITQTPGLKSLFFAQTILPDISRLASTKAISLQECLELLTHKWPMCDIGLIGLNSRDVDHLLSSQKRPGERPRCRSIQICGHSGDSVSERVRSVNKLDKDTKFHMIFVGDKSDLDGLKNCLLPKGFICAYAEDRRVETKPSPSFTRVCDIYGLSTDSWTLWRVDQEMSTSPSNRSTTVFVSPDQEISSITCLPAAKSVSLVPYPAARGSERSKDPFDAVVIDSLEKSIIATWTGEELVPWLQEILESARSVFWVTQQRPRNPYNNIAGNLLRTMQSEQPSIKVTWLVLEGPHHESVIQEAIASAYAGLLSGENEVRLEVKDSQFSVLRYLPDDELSASMGLTAPRFVNEGVFDKDLEVCLSKREESAIKTYNRDYHQTLEMGEVAIRVEASVIDADDMAAFYGSSTYMHLGRFFAGRVNSSTSQAFPLDSQVVGWTSGAHRSLVHTPETRLWPCAEENSAAESAVNLAALSAASCIVDGTARARQGDVVRLRVSGILGQAIAKFCEGLGITVLDSAADGEADFTVETNNVGSLLVNGLPIDLEKYLKSNRGASLVTQVWNERQTFRTPLRSFHLADHQQAFEAAKTTPYTTVLLHSHPEKIPQTIATYHPPTTLFSNAGAYIIIGGLGGLGRYICTWLATHGAKTLIAISRNGLSSPSAHETSTLINASPSSSLSVIKADACDRAAMHAALADIRKRHPIKGVINMAMLLGDAALADMEPWQWDLALRLKVDSSWILHEETLDDELEFFILFSSIASVLGNRNQAGYNVGNTFLNALAEWRREMGRTAVAVALGAMGTFASLPPCVRPLLCFVVTASAVEGRGRLCY